MRIGFVPSCILSEGLDELIRQAIDFDPRYDARNYHDRMWACQLIVDYVRPEDIDKLIPLIGQGAYGYISGHLIEERGTSLIPVLRDELRKDGQVNPYIALTLCRLGDAEGFEITKEILLNYDRYQMLDSPVDWSSGALTLYAEHNPEIILPILVEFLEKEMLRPNGGHPIHIEWVVSRLKRIFSYSTIQNILAKIHRHVRDNPYWTANDRRMVDYLFKSA